jgi:hypothetical protein
MSEAIPTGSRVWLGRTMPAEYVELPQAPG